MIQYVRDGTPVFVGAKQFVALRTDELPLLNETVSSEINWWIVI